MLFASLSFAVVFIFQGANPFLILGKALYTNVLLGFLLAFHWWSFYQSVQLSSVAIGLFCFSTFPVFTLFLAPIISKNKITFLSIVTAPMSVLGIYILMPEFHWHDKYSLAIVWGVLSGLSFSLLSGFNKKLIQQRHPSKKLTFLQNFFALFCLSPFLMAKPPAFSAFQWSQLALLGIVYTALVHVLFVSSLQNIKAQTASVIANLEPVYGVILAYFLFREQLSIQHIIGGSIIILAAVLSSWDIKITKTQ